MQARWRRWRPPLSLNFLYRVPADRRAVLVAFGLENVLTQLSENALAQFVPLYAVQLGVSNTSIGSVAALNNLAAAAAQLPGARLVERHGHRRRWVILSGLVARSFVWALLGATLVRAHAEFVVFLLAFLYAGRGFFLALGQPAWTSLAADIVPTEIRGRYFALRDISVRLSSLLLLPFLGWLVDALPFPWGYRAVFGLAAALATVGWVLFYRRVPDPAPLPAEYLKARPRRTLWQAVRDERDFVAFLVANTVWNMSLAVAAPYFTVYLVRELGGTARWVGVLAAVNSLFGLGGAMVWGRLADRWGNLRVNRLTAVAIPFIPWAWLLVTAAWQVLFISAYGGFMWAGFLISNFNLLLSLSPPRQRARFAALYQMGVLGGMVVGTMVGGVLADLYSIRGTFFLSGLGRMLAALVLVRLVRRGEFTPLAPSQQPAGK